MAAPVFDPNAEYEEEIPVFDPNASFEEEASAPANWEDEFTDRLDSHAAARAPSMLETAGRSFLKGSLRDWSDETIARGADTINKLVGRPSNYDDILREQQVANLRAETENPKTAGLSEFAGIMSTAPLTLNPLTSGAIGAVEGGAQSLGRAKELNPEAFRQAGVDAALSGAGSAAFTRFGPAAMQALSKPFAGAYEGMRNTAGRWAIDALRPTQKMLDTLGKEGRARHGKMALDEGIVTPLASNTKMADRTRAFTQNAYELTRPIYEKSKNSKISSPELYGKIKGQVRDLSQNPETVASARELNKLAKEIEIAEKARYREFTRGKIPESSGVPSVPGTGANANPQYVPRDFNPADLRRYRGSIDKRINWNDTKERQTGLKAMRRLLRKEEFDLIDKVDPALRKQNEKLFKDIHMGNNLEKIAERGEAQSAANRKFGLTTYLAGGLGASLLSNLDIPGETKLILGTLGFFGGEGVRRYGRQMTAVGLNNMAKAIGSPKYAGLFQSALKRGPTEVARLHQALINGDSAYRQAYEAAFMGDEDAPE